MARKNSPASRDDWDSSQGGTKKQIDWPSYDTALKNRGSITFWFSEEAIEGWHPPRGGRRRGGQSKVSPIGPMDDTARLGLLSAFP